MERKGKALENPLKRRRGRDLIRYFEVIGSGTGSSSNPSTRESVNISAHSIHHDQVNSIEVEHENGVPTEQVEEHTTDSGEAIVEENVELERRVMFPTVYRLIELSLLLPIATATVERAFSSMKIIKTELRNKMSDGWLNDLMVCYIERGIFKSLDLDKIKEDFQKEGRALPLPGDSRRH